jgi:hypothetical protein
MYKFLFNHKVCSITRSSSGMMTLLRLEGLLELSRSSNSTLLMFIAEP